MKKILGIISIYLLVFYLFFVPRSWEKQAHIIDVSPGRNFSQVSRELQDKGLIHHAVLLKILVKLYGSPFLKIGEYELSPDLSVWEQFQKLKKGDFYYGKVTFPEGTNHYEIAQLLRAFAWPFFEDFLALCRDKKFIRELTGESLDSLEGYLFPDTYSINKYTEAKELITRMWKQFSQVYSKTIKEQGVYSPFSRHELVTFSSLIEEETGDPKERPVIASVFYNRLRKGMKLQTDPTILYSLYLKEGFDRGKNIRRKDIRFPSKYNTYVVKGLPPGPITNVGEASLRASLDPAKTEYLYFVSRNNGTHYFSTNYKDHKKAVYKYQILPFKKKNR